MNSFGITDRGKVRRENQDSFFIERIDSKGCLAAVVCDGMGGEQAGNVASSLAAKTFITHVTEKISSSKLKKPGIRAIMTQACDEANHLVYEYSCFDSGYTGMGTTLVAAVICEDRTFVLNVGDSRAYKISGKKITQITRDHSLVQEMVDRGEITAEEARNHPRKNVITRALGVNVFVPSDHVHHEVSSEEHALLCSDGLTNMLSDKEILEISAVHRARSLGRALWTRRSDEARTTT
jgi:protein phosphatase